MNYVRITLVVAYFAFASSIAKAEDNAIDARFGKCVDADSTTTSMVECSYKAYDEWDNELNKNYSTLLTKLSPDQKTILRASQRQWILYRDSEFKVIDAAYSHVSGTMYIPMRVNDRTEIVKDRALQLRSYITLIEDDMSN